MRTFFIIFKKTIEETEQKNKSHLYSPVNQKEYKLLLQSITTDLEIYRLKWNELIPLLDYTELYIIEIENDRIFHPSQNPEFGDILQNSLFNAIKTDFGHLGYLRRLSRQRILLIWPCSNNCGSIQKSLRYSLSKPIRLKEKLDIQPIIRVGNTRKLTPFSIDVAMKEAGMALHYASFSEKNRFQMYNNEIKSRFETFLFVNTNIKNAIENGEICFHFQPQFNGRKNLIGYEALIRWFSPQNGFISPEHFIPLLEKTGQICMIGHLGIKKSCEFIKKLNMLNDDFLPVAVNISPFEIMVDGFFDSIISIVDEYGISPAQIHIELTENGLLENIRHVKEQINYLKERGFIIAIDDFGKGYSCLSEIKDFSVQTLKVDKSFLKNIPFDQRECRLIKGLVALLLEIEIDFIFEGVETELQFEYLVSLGCKKFQGFFFSKPLSESRALDMAQLKTCYE